MSKMCAFFLSTALVATSCGGSGDENSEPPPDESVPATVIVSAPASAPPDVAATNPPATDPAATPPPITEPPVSSDPVTLSSDDGELFVTLPGDVAAELGVSIRRLEPSELPPEVAGGENLDSVKVYELEPDGASFDEPVMVTRRLDVAAFDFLALGPNDVPFVTALNRDSSGTYGLLDDLTMTRLGDDLFLSGTTTHFSEFIASNEGSAIRDDRPASTSGVTWSDFEAQESVSEEFVATVLGELVTGSGDFSRIDDLLNRIRLNPYSEQDPFVSGSDESDIDIDFVFDDGPSPVGPPIVAVESTPLDGDPMVIATTQTSTFDIPIDNAPSAWALTDGNLDQPASIEYAVQTFAAQVPVSYFPEPFLSGLQPVATVETNHTALEAYASFLRVLLSGLGGLAAEDRLFLAIRDSGPLSRDSQLIDVRSLDVLADGAATVDLGIECFCEYEFVMFYLAEADELASQALDEATTLDEVLAILAAQENIARLMLGSEPAVFSVGSTEGPIVEDVQLTLELLTVE